MTTDPTPDTVPDAAAIAYWCEMTQEDPDGELAAEAVKEVTGTPLASHVLRVAGELWDDEPPALAKGHSLGEIDYLWIVQGALKGEVFDADTTAADLRERLVGVHSTRSQAVHAAMAHVGAEYPEHIRHDAVLGDEEADELEKITVNMVRPPGAECFETTDGMWVVYTHTG